MSAHRVSAQGVPALGDTQGSRGPGRALHQPLGSCSEGAWHKVHSVDPGLFLGPALQRDRGSSPRSTQLPWGTARPHSRGKGATLQPRAEPPVLQGQAPSGTVTPSLRSPSQPPQEASSRHRSTQTHAAINSRA